MILESVENGPLLWPSIEENEVTRSKKYSELSATEVIQADCDVKATNIILQGLPPEKGESLREFYLRFSLLLNDINIYNMKLEQFQVKIMFLNTLPPEWSKFMTNVKLVRDLHTTNVDQLHAYLGQHEFHANERTVVCYKCKGEGHVSKQCTKPKRKRDESWFKDKAMPLSEQSNIVNQSETEITSYSNIIPYSQYLKTQVVNCTKINLVNKSVNETLTTELDRYKDQVRDLKEQNNVDKDSDSCAQSVEIDNLKQTLSEHLKEKESLK
nr:hypothetical protein [Tanacetum cinerariifolium]